MTPPDQLTALLNAFLAETDPALKERKQAAFSMAVRELLTSRTRTAPDFLRLAANDRED